MIPPEKMEEWRALGVKLRLEASRWCSDTSLNREMAKMEADAAGTIFALLDEVERLREALVAVLADMPMIECERMNHNKGDFHNGFDCPVEKRMEKAIECARAALTPGTPNK